MAHFNYNKPSKLGSDLTREEQQYVLATYVHRFTGDHKPAWASKEWKDGQPYPLQFNDDKDWLANTRFQTNKAGSLDSRCNECHSVPTWPNNSELASK